VSVTHFTPRNSTAIEWVILESVNLLQTKTKYQDVSIHRFFSDILQIADSNLLIKPCIIDLMDLGALETSSEIYDSVDLAEVKMGELRLTDVGREMQMRGLLPGTEIQSDARFVYFLFDRSLSSVEKMYPTISQGVEIVDDDESPENVDMPVQTIRSFLNDSQNVSRFSWMNANTEIRDIQDESDGDDTQVKWQISSEIVNVSGDGVVSLQKYDSAFIVDKVIDYLAKNNSIDLQEGPFKEKIAVKNIDEEYKKVVLPNAFMSTFRDEASRVPVFIVESSLYDLGYFKKTEKSEVAPRIAIIYGDHAFNCNYNFELKSLEIQIPFEMVASLRQVAYASRKSEFIIGNISLYSKNDKIPVTVALLPQKSIFDFESCCLAVVEKYAHENSDVLYILAGIDRMDLLVERIQFVLDESGKNLFERAKKMKDLSEKGLRYLGKRLFTLDAEKKLLLDKWEPDAIQFSELKALLEQLLSCETIAWSTGLFNMVVEKILSKTAAASSFENLLDLSKYVDSKKQVKEVFQSAHVLHKLGSDENIELLFKSFGKIPPQMSTLIGVEGGLISLQKAIADLKIELERLGYNSDMSSTEKRFLILKNGDNLLALNVKVNGCKKARANLNEFLRKRASIAKTAIAGTDYFDKPDFALYQEAQSLVRDVIETITPYLGAQSANFDEIYIVDTCAVMAHPELMDSFKTNRAALIIPKTVLEELDRNKMKKEDEVDIKAQRAIKKIAECRDLTKQGKKWLFFEEGNASLLPKEYNNAEKQPSGDDMILSVALKYKLKDPVIITNDINLSNKLYGEFIKQVSSDAFLKKTKK
jgi:rRNA-processing protein FCF1